MILAIDIGNTNIKIGLFKDGKLNNSWRLSSDVSRTADEYGATLKQLMSISGVSCKSISGAIMSSVLPQLNYTVEHALSYYFGLKPLLVNADFNTGLILKYKNPHELGTDRIVNCVAALSEHKPPFVVIDFGTATTYNVINENNEFVGGLIALGIKGSVEALASATAKLPRVEILRTKNIIGDSTRANIQSGAYFGAVGQVRYIISEIKQQLNAPHLKVIATGGIAELFSEEKGLVDVIDRTLSLKGLNILYQLNCNK